MPWSRLKNPLLQKRLVMRARIIQLVREFFISQGFVEMGTPLVVRAAGQEPYLDPFGVNFLGPKREKIPAYLITSPEYAHKKLLAAGFKKTFEITRSFRGAESWHGTHNPEFTMIEWYRAVANYKKIMDDVEQMVYGVARGMMPDARNTKQIKILYRERSIDLTPPWERLSMQEAWERNARIEKGADICDRKILLKLCRERGYRVKNTESYDDAFFKIFLTEVEPCLGKGKPTILYDYPASMAALARRKKNCPRWAERFEVYAEGLELGNAFSELNDAKEQRARFLAEQQLRRKLGKPLIPLDEDFLNALSHMPPSAGIAFGIDRLVMLLTDAKSIDEVMAFPASEIFE